MLMQTQNDAREDTVAQTDAAPILALDGITKTFPGVTALSDVSLKLYGTPANALELMSLNELDDALNIRVGTPIRYRVAA